MLLTSVPLISGACPFLIIIIIHKLLLTIRLSSLAKCGGERNGCEQNGCWYTTSGSGAGGRQPSQVCRGLKATGIGYS